MRKNWREGKKRGEEVARGEDGEWVEVTDVLGVVLLLVGGNRLDFSLFGSQKVPGCSETCESDCGRSGVDILRHGSIGDQAHHSPNILMVVCVSIDNSAIEAPTPPHYLGIDPNRKIKLDHIRVPNIQYPSVIVTEHKIFIADVLLIVCCREVTDRRGVSMSVLQVGADRDDVEVGLGKEEGVEGVNQNWEGLLDQGKRVERSVGD